MLPTMNPLIESIPEALSIYINQIVYEKKNRGERVYTYSLGEAFFDIPRFPITDVEMQSGYHYSSSLGVLELRKCISEMYYNRYGVVSDYKSEIIISAGSKPLVYMVLQAILAPEDEVLYHEPAWLSYKELTKIAGGKSVGIPYYVDINEWGKYITPKTKVLIVNNPNNPSGRLYSREEIDFLISLARKNNMFILADEAYSDFLLQNNKFISFAGVDRKKENVIVVNSLSKNMGMSGWRVGYAIAHDIVIKQLLKLNQHIVTCAATFLQEYMAKHFDDILKVTLPQAIITAEKRWKVRQIMKEVGIKCLEGVGTFYFLVDVSEFVGTTDDLVYDLLLNHNIATVPGGAYGDSTRDFIRFGIGVEPLEDIRNSLLVIKDFLRLETYNPIDIENQMKNLGIVH